MDWRDRYTLLMSSLPAHERWGSRHQTPLSRLKLERRLRLLSQPDADLLARIESLLQWRELPITSDNQQLVLRQRKLLETLRHDDTRPRAEATALLALIQQRLDVRTLVAALWRREYQQDNDPPPSGLWSVSRYRQTIEQYWHEPTFRLEVAQPWLPQALTCIRSHQPWELEQMLLQHNWILTGRYLLPGDNSLVAVVAYVLKWDMLDRRIGYDATQAQARFSDWVAVDIAAVTAVEPGPLDPKASSNFTQSSTMASGAPL
ncbi:MULTISPECIES: hypothetical protein [unclassified Oceanobacter]|jgi:hypothetical protein|uniref:hypothetical protein n=1 Tax=unclassified Oceanobacter TaxID=2620260 RepID=UPI0026E16862|nr:MULTISPECIES: hypothetical protein [unclassified Oceanobacter]MDO6681595.1 hypothetical protein [Oceanobacter sp. 5_MG-2023]MDP2547396.1 hypothetical protein [Oceanobacter sp. 4_MG-2023]MDP2608184.1 hypothetical protein [Oceanobacter sp. 1_MG-2023]MDP2612910.1 hypothetical protein [Oceanobacter sp. 2_MG-2023]